MPNTSSSSRSLSRRLRRLGLCVAAGVGLLYLAAVTAGYLWLRVGRDNRHVGFLDVALLQQKSVRKALAMGYLDQAREEVKKKDYQAAYIAFTAATNNDPSNLEVRLEAVAFFREMGADSLALALLEDGLRRAPGDPRLIKQTCDQLLATGRARHLLELLRQCYPGGFSGDQVDLLQSYEINATLQTEGAAAAQRLLTRHPGLVDRADIAPVAARILWASGERLRAIRMLSAHIATDAAVFADYRQLADWQVAAAQMPDAVQTAQQACRRLKDDLSARVLLIEMNAAEAVDGRPRLADIEGFLRESSGRPEALGKLALLAGRKGWVELARSLYDIGAARLPDVGQLAMSYADALAHHSRFREVRQVLAQMEAQLTDDSSVNYVRQILHRQVIAAGAMNDAAAVRDHAQRLASSLGRDTERIEAFRNHFQQVGLTEAVASFTPRGAAPKTADAKPKTGG